MEDFPESRRCDTIRRAIIKAPRLRVLPPVNCAAARKPNFYRRNFLRETRYASRSPIVKPRWKMLNHPTFLPGEQMNKTKFETDHHSLSLSLSPLDNLTRFSIVVNIFSSLQLSTCYVNVKILCKYRASSGTRKTRILSSRYIFNPRVLSI